MQNDDDFYNWYLNIAKKDYNAVVNKNLIYLKDSYYNLVNNIEKSTIDFENQFIKDKLLLYFNEIIEEYKEFDVCQNKGYKYYNNLLCWYSFVNDNIKALK